MEQAIITFLGTGNAVPTKLRNHTSVLVQYREENMLIDCGEGTQRQFRHAGLSPNKLTRIFITHWHGDHVLGLPGLFQTLAMSGYQRELEIYGPQGTKRMLSLIQELLGKIRINLKVYEVQPGVIIDKREYQIVASSMEHDTPCLAYSLIIKDKRRLNKSKLRKLKVPNSPLLGKLASGKDIIFNGRKIKARDVCYIEKGKKITFILDTSYTERAITLAKDSDLIICESTFAKEEAERAKEYKHLTSIQAAKIAKKAKAKALLLTHISQRYEYTPHIIEKEAKKVFKNTKIAKDLDVIVL